MKPAKILALCLTAALSVPFGSAQACVDGVTEVSFEGDPNGKEPFKLTTPGGGDEPARTWIDDDGLPTLMTILQSAEDKTDVSAYGDLFKKSLARLATKAEGYKKSIDDKETQAHYQALADGAKKFLTKIKDKPLEKKDIEAFYKEMGDPVYGSIIDGVFGYQLLDPKTGKPADPEEPFAPIGSFGPAVKFTYKIDGTAPKGAGCGTYSLKVKQAAKKAGANGGDTYMVNPGN